MSVVVPVHNRVEVLAETLESVRAQSLPDWECIVVDDRSSDGSHELAQAFARRDPRFRAVQLTAGRRYQCAARNLGLSMARGEYVNFLDSDDLFAVDKLLTQTQHLESHPDIDVSLTLYAKFEGARPEIVSVLNKVANPAAFLDAILDQREFGFVMNTITPMWRTSTLCTLGGWNEDRRFYEDSELALRAIINGARLGRIESVLAFVRTGWRVAGRRPAGSPPDADTLVLADTWRLLREAGMQTTRRRCILAARSLRRARSQRRRGHLLTALAQWLQASRILGFSIAGRAFLALTLVTPASVSDRLLRNLRWGDGGPASQRVDLEEAMAVLLSQDELQVEARRELTRVFAALGSVTA